MLQWYIQPRNGYNQYYFALDSIFRRQVNNIEARPRPKVRGRGQLVEANAEAKILASRPVWPRGDGLEALTSLEVWNISGLEKN